MMPSSRTSAPASDRGAVLVHTAFALLALIAFTTFVADYGTLWLARGQVQNAADAGALAGAVTMMMDEPNVDEDDPDSLTKRTAEQVAESNLVYGQAPDVVRATDITIMCPDCAVKCPDDPERSCIRVDAYRNAVRNNPLPVFFGTLVGLTQQGVRATATAEISGANTAKCMLPWALQDRWGDAYDPTPDTATFPNDADHLGTSGEDEPAPAIKGWSPNDFYEPTGSPADYYIPPYYDDTTGWSTTRDFGRQLSLHRPVGQFSPGWANTVNLPGSTGGADVRADISGCNPNFIGIADETWDCYDHGYPVNTTTVQEALDGCLSAQTGEDVGNVKLGVKDLLAQDSTAEWKPTADGGKGAVVRGSELAWDSPRIRPLSIFQIDEYIAEGCMGSTCIVKIVNIVGFFVEGTCGDLEAAGELDPGVVCEGPPLNPDAQVVGRLVTLPSRYLGEAGNPVNESSFLQIVRLIR
jgi:hypothetical protein